MGKKSRRPNRQNRFDSAPISRSPITGDLGFRQNPWFRIDHKLIRFPYPTVAFGVSELRATGHTPESLGMVKLSSTEVVEIVSSTVIGVDLKSKRDVDVVRVNEEDIAKSLLVIGGVFPDSHSNEWWHEAHSAGELILIASDTRALASAGRNNPDKPFDMVQWLGGAGPVGHH